ncbi:Aldo-ket-red domain-containing protein [Aphelenchoides fujianensis]|nr:Aldo-ket-red domain-containing protein [Aphelenchoides fujianensis]
MTPFPHYVTMSNGLRQPLAGLGTLANKDLDELRRTLNTAIDAGVRYIDTAWYYGNEAQIGEVLEEIFKSGKVKREDIFITTKLPPHRYQPAEAEKDQLKDLRTDYVDLYLMHSPCTIKMNPDGTAAKDGEEMSLYKAGKIHSLGISNFSAKQTQALYDQAEIKPHNIQATSFQFFHNPLLELKVELHIYHRQRELVALCKKLDITVTSYASLGSPAIKGVGGNNRNGVSVEYPEHGVLGHPLAVELAKKYGKTPGQILLRHLTQLGISVIPKSSNEERIRQNIDIFDFELTPEELKRFDDIQEDFRLFVQAPWKNHPWYPFKEGN